LIIIKSLIKDPIKGVVLECETAKEYLEKITSHFTRSSKAYACSLMMEFFDTKYDGSGVRPFIHKMISIVSKLKKIPGAINARGACCAHDHEVSA
jgi:hypothetical protein